MRRLDNGPGRPAGEAALDRRQRPRLGAGEGLRVGFPDGDDHLAEAVADGNLDAADGADHFQGGEEAFVVVGHRPKVGPRVTQAGNGVARIPKAGEVGIEHQLVELGLVLAAAGQRGDEGGQPVEGIGGVAAEDGGFGNADGGFQHLAGLFPEQGRLDGGEQGVALGLGHRVRALFHRRPQARGDHQPPQLALVRRGLQRAGFIAPQRRLAPSQQGGDLGLGQFQRFAPGADLGRLEVAARLPEGGEGGRLPVRVAAVLELGAAGLAAAEDALHGDRNPAHLDRFRTAQAINRVVRPAGWAGRIGKLFRFVVNVGHRSPGWRSFMVLPVRGTTGIRRSAHGPTGRISI